MSDRSDQHSIGSTAFDRRDGPNLLPPRAAIAELVLLLGLIVGVAWLVPTVDVTQLQPNPFWLPVLALSLQYGTVSGLLAAAGAIAISLLGFPLPEQENGENLFIYTARTFAQPVLWIAAAVLIGQFRVRQIEAKRGLVRAVDILTAERTSLASYAQGLRQRCDRLEREIVGRSTPPMLSAMAALDDLLAADPASLTASTALDRAFAAVLPGASGFIVARANGRPVVIAGRPVSTDSAFDRAVAELTAAVLEHELDVDVLSREGEVRLAGLGSTAVAIKAPGRTGDGSRVAVLVVDRIPADAVGSAMLSASRMVARAVAPTVAVAVAQLPKSDHGFAAIAPAMQIVAPLALPEIGRPKTSGDTAVASRRWAKFGWVPGLIAEPAAAAAIAPAPKPTTPGPMVPGSAARSAKISVAAKS